MYLDTSRRPFSTETTGAIQHKSPITARDKLPWPYPYENVEKEFKWKVISSPIHQNNYHHSSQHPSFNILPHIHTTVLPTEQATSSIFSTDLNSYPTIPSSTSPHHPYAYEKPFDAPNSNQPKIHSTTFDGETIDGFATPYIVENIRPDNHLGNTTMQGNNDSRYLHSINKELCRLHKYIEIDRECHLYIYPLTVFVFYSSNVQCILAYGFEIACDSCANRSRANRSFPKNCLR